MTGANEGLSTLVLEKTEFARRHHRLLGGHLLDPGQPLPAGRRRHRRRAGGEPLPRRAGRRPGPAGAARGLPGARRRDGGVPRPGRCAVLALEEGRRLPPGDPRLGARPRAGAADLRRPHARHGGLRPDPAAGAGVRAVRRDADGAQARGERAARDLRGPVLDGTGAACSPRCGWACGGRPTGCATRAAPGWPWATRWWRTCSTSSASAAAGSGSPRPRRGCSPTRAGSSAPSSPTRAASCASGPGAASCWRAAASRRARTGGRATCRPRRRSTPARARARPATRWRSPRPSAARSASPATTTRSGSPARSAAAATARPRCSRTSGTGPSRASSR